MPPRGATQEALLRALRLSGEEPLSGQKLAGQLGVSRAAVHKAAQALQRQGYRIQASSGLGYRLCRGGDVLSREALLEALAPHSPVTRCHVYEEVPSTNRTARALAGEGALQGTLVVAGRQAEGRGRLGRTFVSPEGGVYLSLILRPGGEAADALSVTGCAAVAVCRAVERLCGRQLAIKWVNDLFYKGKKVGGILTEAVSHFETGRLEFLTVGIGVNLATPAEAFPPEVAKVAGSLFLPGQAPCSRVELAAAIAQELLNLGIGRDYLPEYRARSLVVGHYLTVTGDGEPYTAFARGIDGEGRLLITLSGGGEKALRYGEMSIRPAPGSF